MESQKSKVPSGILRAGKSQKLPVKREFSAGGIVYRKSEVPTEVLRAGKSRKSDFLWLIGKHSGYHKWVLPKGLIEKGEKGFETAVRETEEEMGVKAKLIFNKPILREQYWFVAEFKNKELGISDKSRRKKPIRRVEVYQENPEIYKSRRKMRVFKTVSFYLMKYVSGNPKNHGWEMSEAGWFAIEEALEKLAFKGEKEALEKANDIILGE